MKQLVQLLRRAGVFEPCAVLIGPDRPCWLVGGALRDWLLGRATADFDFATPDDPTPLAQELATAVGGKWFFLDEARRQSRVVFTGAAGRVSCDFAPFRGPDLGADLAGRDFTVNALALPLHAPPESWQLVDPLGGEEDLRRGVLRACAAGALREDPLRVLRGVRYAVLLGLEIAKETVALMQEAAPLVAGMAPERMRAELGKLLAPEPVVKALRLSDVVGLSAVLFGANGEDGSLEEGMVLAARLEEGCRHLSKMAGAEWLDPWLEEEAEAGLSRRTLLRLGAFLRGWRAEEEAAGGRLRLSRASTALIQAVVTAQEERLAELPALACAPRGRAQWVASLGSEPVATLLALVACTAPGRGLAPHALEALAAYRGHLEKGHLPDLVDGEWIRRELGWETGPAIGEALRRLRLEEIAGRVNTPAEAQNFLKSLG